MPLLWRPAREDAPGDSASFGVHDAGDEPTILPPTH
jgi:hypothetical protein